MNEDAIRQAMRIIGSRGGRSKSPAKMAAMAMNLAKARAMRSCVSVQADGSIVGD
jgi:hypothetical protein